MSMSELEYDRKCPNCGTPIYLAAGCNEVACICGKHFCFYCGECYDTSKEVFKHMREADHLFHCPPDIAKRRGRNPSEEVLNEFYKKYPKLLEQ